MHRTDSTLDAALCLWTRGIDPEVNPAADLLTFTMELGGKSRKCRLDLDTGFPKLCVVLGKVRGHYPQILGQIHSLPGFGVGRFSIMHGSFLWSLAIDPEEDPDAIIIIKWMLALLFTAANRELLAAYPLIEQMLANVPEAELLRQIVFLTLAPEGGKH